MFSLKNKQSGAGLIEVLVALLVFSLGIVGIMKFQSSLLKETGSANERTGAVELAERKINDLRNFLWVTAATGRSYTDIASNAGGEMASGTYTINNINYSLSWNVVDCYDNASGTQGSCLTQFTTSVPTGSTHADYKEVTVQASWTGRDGESYNVSLNTAIDSLPTTNDGQATGGGNKTYGLSLTQPDYNPGLAPEVIRVKIDSGDTYKESSKALPDVSQHGNYNVVEFDVVSFDNGGGTPTRIRQEEFVTVNCKCDFIAGGDIAATPARVAWDAANEEIFDQPGALVNKAAGELSNDNELPEVCASCCNDHHDVSSESIKYVTTSSYEGNGDHAHFNSVGNNVLSGTYLEACRLKIVNGQLRVFQDWKLNTLTVLPDDFLFDGTSTQTAYINYITSFVLSVNDGTSTFTTPDKPSGREKTLGQGASRQFLARAIFMDEMSSENIAFVNTQIRSITSILAADPTTSRSYSEVLQFVPFVEQNMTKIIPWKMAFPTTTSQNIAADETNQDPCPPGSSNYVLCVSNEAIVDESVSEDNYSRGSVVAGSTTGTNIRRVIAYANPDNTGVTGTAALSPDFETTADEARDKRHPHADFLDITQNFNITTANVEGDITFCSGLTGPEKNTVYASIEVGGISYAGTDASSNPITGSCTVNAKQGNSGSYVCSSIEVGSIIVIVPAATSFPTPSTIAINPILAAGHSGQDIEICDS